MLNETQCHRQDIELIEEFVDYFTNGFSISDILSMNKEHMSSHI